MGDREEDLVGRGKGREMEEEEEEEEGDRVGKDGSYVASGRSSLGTICSQFYSTLGQILFSTSAAQRYGLPVWRLSSFSRWSTICVATIYSGVLCGVLNEVRVWCEFIRPNDFYGGGPAPTCRPVDAGPLRSDATACHGDASPVHMDGWMDGLTPHLQQDGDGERKVVESCTRKGWGLWSIYKPVRLCDGRALSRLAGQ